MKMITQIQTFDDADGDHVPVVRDATHHATTGAAKVVADALAVGDLAANEEFIEHLCDHDDAVESIGCRVNLYRIEEGAVAPIKTMLRDFFDKIGFAEEANGKTPAQAKAAKQARASEIDARITV